MERQRERSKHYGIDSDDDRTKRLASRSNGGSQGSSQINKKALGGDVGSTFGGKPQKGKPLVTFKSGRQPRPVLRPREHDSDSDSDPLDTLSETTQPSPVKPAPKEKNDGIYRLDQDKGLKGLNLRFTRNKPRTDGPSSSIGPQANENSYDKKPPRSTHDNARISGSSNPMAGIGMKTKENPRDKKSTWSTCDNDRTSGYTSPPTSRKPRVRDQNIRASSPDSEPPKGPPITRPKPRPPIKQPPAKKAAQPFPMDFESPAATPSRKKVADKKKKRREPTLELSSEEDGPTSLECSAGPSNKPRPQEFPMQFSPIGGPPPSSFPSSNSKPTLAPFPMSPLGSQCRPFLSEKEKKKDKAAAKGKGKKMVIISTDEEEDDEGEDEAPHVQPFPLSTQFLCGSPLSSPLKRISSKTMDDEDDTTPRKRPRESIGAQLLEDERLEEADSVFISPHTDPKTLCPYCDLKLPPTPSPLLQQLLKAAEKRTHQDPRPSNPLGRKGPFARYIAVCQRHRFETQILPEAEAKGWPRTINWKKLASRIQTMKEDLMDLILDPQDDSIIDLSGDDNDGLGTGPRSECIFWREVMKAAKDRSSRAVLTAKNQFHNFEKTQPGYYGELGSVIIHQTLHDMFPPSSYDVERIVPLGPEEFIQMVLVPEVALRLIMEDRSLTGRAGKTAALAVLRESSNYGVGMFPSDVGEDGGEISKQKKNGEGVAAGERIVKERARKRRIEIEAEELKEEKLERERRERGDEEEEMRVTASSEGDIEGPSVVPPRPKPRPKPRAVVKPPPTDDGMDSNANPNGGLFSSPTRIHPATSGASRKPRSRCPTDQSDHNMSDVAVNDSDMGATGGFEIHYSRRESRSPSVSELRRGSDYYTSEPPSPPPVRASRPKKRRPSPSPTRSVRRSRSVSIAVDDEPPPKANSKNKKPSTPKRKGKKGTSVHSKSSVSEAAQSDMDISTASSDSDDMKHIFPLLTKARSKDTEILDLGLEATPKPKHRTRAIATSKQTMAVNETPKPKAKNTTQVTTNFSTPENEAPLAKARRMRDKKKQEAEDEAAVGASSSQGHGPSLNPDGSYKWLLDSSQS